MKARKYAEIARMGTKMLGGVRLVEDDDDSNEPDVGELARQIITDLIRETMTAAANQAVDVVGDTSTGSFEIGVPEGDDRSTMIQVRIEVGKNEIVFFVNNKQAATCDRTLNGYPEAQRQVAKSINAARMEVVDSNDEYGSTPNYAGFNGLGGPYG